MGTRVQQLTPANRVVEVIAGEEAWLLAVFRLPRDDGVRFPNRAAVVAGSLQTVVCDLCPKLLNAHVVALLRRQSAVLASVAHQYPTKTGARFSTNALAASR